MSVLPQKVSGLGAFGLSPSQAKRLGPRLVTVTIQQRGVPLTRLVALSPEERNRKLSDVLQAGLARLRRRWPDAGIAPRGTGQPWTLDAVIAASELAHLAAEPCVSGIHVTKVRGLRPSRVRRKQELRWFCVRGSVAIQIEGRTRGLVDVEDRLVLVKAHTEADAKKRLAKYWSEWAKPYLNVYGELVRWQLIEVRDVYELPDEAIDSNGTEVYSRIRSKRMQPAYVWEPSRRGARRASTK